MLLRETLVCLIKLKIAGSLVDTGGCVEDPHTAASRLILHLLLIGFVFELVVGVRGDSFQLLSTVFTDW